MTKGKSMTGLSTTRGSFPVLHPTGPRQSRIPTAAQSAGACYGSSRPYGGTVAQGSEAVINPGNAKPATRGAHQTANESGLRGS